MPKAKPAKKFVLIGRANRAVFQHAHTPRPVSTMSSTALVKNKHRCLRPAHTCSVLNPCTKPHACTLLLQVHPLSNAIITLIFTCSNLLQLLKATVLEGNSLAGYCQGNEQSQQHELEAGKMSLWAEPTTVLRP